MRKRFVWDPEKRNMTKMPPEESAEKSITYSPADFRAAVEAEVKRITTQLPTQADFEAAVAAEVERRLAMMQAAAQEDVKVLHADPAEETGKMGVTPDKKGEKAEKAK